MKKQPVLITDAARSQGDQYRSRQVRYVTMMSVRAGCLILGAVLVSVRPPWLGLWLILCAAGMVFLPWFAVLIANDRPARTKDERAAAAFEREQEQQAALVQHPVEEVEYLTIDGEHWTAAEPERDRKL
ncbi:DUF3099 domain-containing protein [Actinoplanes sp. NPDC026619]|uniref:DUF3099 domain-containing protein n=1 Tax=Actinoplanes sp. NPDC026619 TaxID=3155798 RepID=UPI0033E56901